MSKKNKLLYTDSANERMDVLFHDLRKEIERYFIDRKYVYGDEKVEITSSDVEELSKRIVIKKPNKKSSIKLILITYSFLGILITLTGLFYEDISFIINSDNKFRFTMIVTGLMLTLFSYVYYFIRFKETSRTFDGGISNVQDSDNLVSMNKERFIELINQQNKELQVKRRKNILVLSQSDEEMEFLKSFFKKMEFKNVDFRRIQNNLDTTNYDLVIFNNENGSLEISRIYEIANNATNDTMFFYFGGVRLDLSEIHKIKNRLAISNLRPQLYGNIIQALIYQDTLENIELKTGHNKA